MKRRLPSGNCGMFCGKAISAGINFAANTVSGDIIVDFYFPSERLAIELDGDSHFTDEGIEYDNERTAFLNGLNNRY